MLQELVKWDELPDGALVLAMEKHDSVYRGVVLERDSETGAASVCDIVEANTVTDVVECLSYADNEKACFWLPVEDGPNIRYLQPDCLSLTEAAEACVGIPFRRDDPPQPLSREAFDDGNFDGGTLHETCRQLFRLIEDIKDALNTEEDGEALIEVARNACRAEQELAALKRKEQEDV